MDKPTPQFKPKTDRISQRPQWSCNGLHWFAGLLIALFVQVLLLTPANPLTPASAASPLNTPTPVPTIHPNPIGNDFDDPTRTTQPPTWLEAIDGVRFWETAVGDTSGTLPGPEDWVRVIVQLDDVPVSDYFDPLVPSSLPLASTDAARPLQDYTHRLATHRHQLLAQAHQQGLTSKLNHEFDYLFNGMALTIKMSDWPRWEQLPGVKAVHPDYQAQVVIARSVPLIGAPSLWGMTDTHNLPVTGQGVRVAVVDTGIDYTHPDLGGGFGPGYKVIGGYDFVNRDGDPKDDMGHGTYVAGIIAASGTITGVAPDVRLLAYKACDRNGNCWTSAITSALERAVDPDRNPATNDGAHVINLSIAMSNDPNSLINQLLDRLMDRGIVVVIAAGNSGDDYHTLANAARKPLVVGATDSRDRLAYFSSRGPVSDTGELPKPDLTAPGVWIGSTGRNGGRSYGSGTSAAAPHVAGAAALLKQLHPDWTAAMIKANLMNTAKDLELDLYQQGAGRLQIEQAATVPLLAMPASLGLGNIGIKASARLTLTNLTTATITTTASVTTILWANLGTTWKPLTDTAPVPYAALSHNELTILPGVTHVLTISLNVPADAPAGHYTGKIILNGDGYTLTVPFAFRFTPPPLKTLTLQPGVNRYTGFNDSYISSVAPTRNFGTASDLVVRGNDSIDSLLRFDLSALPAEARIITATLELYSVKRTGTASLAVNIYPLLRSWNQRETTWHQATTAVAWGQAGANCTVTDRTPDPVASQTVNRVATWYRFNVTSAARAWTADPASNQGLVIKGYGDSATQYTFASSRYPTVGQRPKLVIQYR